MNELQGFTEREFVRCFTKRDALETGNQQISIPPFLEEQSRDLDNLLFRKPRNTKLAKAIKARKKQIEDAINDEQQKRINAVNKKATEGEPGEFEAIPAQDCEAYLSKERNVICPRKVSDAMACFFKLADAAISEVSVEIDS